MKSWSHAVDFIFFNLGTLGFCQRVGFVFYLYFFMFLLIFIFILNLILYSNYILCILFATLNSWNTQIKIRYAIFEYFKLNSSDFFTKISLNQNRGGGGPKLCTVLPKHGRFTTVLNTWDHSTSKLKAFWCKTLFNYPALHLKIMQSIYFFHLILLQRKKLQNNTTFLLLHVHT